MSGNRYEDMINSPDADAAPVTAPAVPGRMPSGNRYEDMVAETTSPVPQPKPRPPAELRAAEYSPRQWLGNKAQDALIALGAKPYVAGRVGRGVLDAASLIPPVGASIAAAETGYHANRGDLLMAGVNAIGMVPGGTAARRAVQGMPQRTLAPEAEQLGRAKEQAYDAWRQAPVTYSPAMMDDAVNEITRTLIQNGADPAVKQSALNIGLGLRKQTGMTNNDFELLRRQLGGGKDASEIRAGEIAKEALENYLINPPAQHIRSGTPQQIATARENLLTGRGNAAAEFRSDVISGKENLAEIAEERGRSFTGTFRDRMGGLSSGSKASEKALRGFNDAEREAVRNEVAGSLLERTSGRFGGAIENAAGKVGLAGGAYGGAVPVTTGGILGTGFGLDPVTGAAIAGGMYAGGKMAGKGMQEYSTSLAKRSAEDLGANIRMRSPLAQAPGSPYGNVTDPAAMVSDARKYMMYPWLARDGEEGVEAMRTPFEYR